MQKKTKRIITLTILLLIIILAIILLILNTTKPILQSLTEQAKAEYTTQIGEQTYDITNAVLDPENITPTISAGMIPIKWSGTNWVITTVEDKNWYNYSKGQLAYIMLNDGYYQSELIQNMNSKELAENAVGNDALVVPNVANNNPTIYMWIPRYAYNSQGEILYIKQGCSVAGTYTVPEIFTYETEKIDFSLAGIWVEYTPLASTSTVNTKINNMTGENNQYGFIANTIVTNANNETSYKTTIETYINKLTANTVGAGLVSARASEEYLSNVGNDALVVPQITDISNTNRTILKITNSSIPEPIKAHGYYDETEEKIKIEVTYRTNAITKILNFKGDILSENLLTADTGDEIIGNKTYKYIVIDNLGNIKEITTEVTGLDIYIIETEEDLKLFRNAVNSGKTTASTKAYQIADVKMNEGKYTINEETGNITFASDAELWSPIGNNVTRCYSGTYDGQGHTISGIYINTVANYQGLFGCYGGTSIKGLGLINSKVSGGQHVGGIIGNAGYGNCIIENCYNASNVTGTNSVGGVVGSNPQQIRNCYNLGVIQGKDSVGGIVGLIAEGKRVTNCYNAGNIYQSNGSNVASPVGGIVGSNRLGTIRYCYNLGDVKGTRITGGIVGENGVTYSDKKNSIVLNCVNVSDNIVGGTQVTGKICGDTSGMGIINFCDYYKKISSLCGIGRVRSSSNISYNSNSGCTIYSDISQMLTALSVINDNNAFVEDTNNINNGYPILAWQAE